MNPFALLMTLLFLGRRRRRSQRIVVRYHETQPAVDVPVPLLNAGSFAEPRPVFTQGRPNRPRFQR